jgi:hypothetical protein
MRFPLPFLVFLLVSSVSILAHAQGASAPAGWPRAMPLPPAFAASGTTTRSIVQHVPAPALSAEQIAKRFQIAGNEVYDRKTDLTWQRCDFGQSWDEANAWCRGVKKHGTVDALAEAAASAGAGWRMPTLDEMTSMLEVACGSQARDTAPVFAEIEHGAGLAYYLTSSPNGSGEGIMGQQCFGGSTLMPAGLGRKYVSVTRLVRTGAVATR